MARSRRSHDRQVKLEAVALLEGSGRLVRAIEKELGIGEGCLSHWRKELAEKSLSDTESGLSDIE